MKSKAEITEEILGKCCRGYRVSPMAEEKLRDYIRQYLDAITRPGGTPIAPLHCDDLLAAMHLTGAEGRSILQCVDAEIKGTKGSEISRE